MRRTIAEPHQRSGTLLRALALQMIRTSGVLAIFAVAAAVLLGSTPPQAATGASSLAAAEQQGDAQEATTTETVGGEVVELGEIELVHHTCRVHYGWMGLLKYVPDTERNVTYVLMYNFGSRRYEQWKTQPLKGC